MTTPRALHFDAVLTAATSIFLSLASRGDAADSSDTGSVSDTDKIDFQQGSPTPPAALLKSARASAVHQVAQLTADAAIAFDRGEVERARGLARAAVQKLEALENDEEKRGNGRQRSSFATQRGRLHRDFLGDAEAAEGAFADAVVSDGENKMAQRALAELLDRKTARTKAAQRKEN